MIRSRSEEALHRRLALGSAGFGWDPPRSVWRRGGLVLSDEQIDTLEPWGALVQRWHAAEARPQPH